MISEAAPIVNLTFVGEVHLENGRLISGDTDVVKRFMAAWGGHRQLGKITLMFAPIPLETTEVSPSGDGIFSEGSEPAVTK
jgi:hypothetical protein